MAKAKRRKTTQRKNTKQINNNIIVISTIIVSILLAVLIYTNSGYIGKTLSPILGGIIGWIKYILPIGVFLIGIAVARESKISLSTRLIEFGIFLLCISSIMSIYQVSKGNINIDGEFEQIIKQSYELGEKNIGGGVIGMIITTPMIGLLGMTGAAIVFVGVFRINTSIYV